MRHARRSILAATDLGISSDAIVRSAALLARSSGAELHLLHALELTRRRADPDRRKLDGFRSRFDEAEKELARQIERTVPPEVTPASEEVVLHRADRAILERAREVSADLIVVGSHRGSEAGAHFLGTTADRVIRTAEIPCLVVDEPLAEPIRRIGVPVDFSDPSQGALEIGFAESLRAAAGGSGRAVLHVVHAGLPMDLAGDPEMESREIRPRLEERVKRAQERVPGAEKLEVEIDVIWGNSPADTILSWAKAEDVDLLVMGTHGRGGISRALIGSTASAVARRTPRPVMLVPPSLWSGSETEPRLEHVMVATDFSEASLAAARWAARIAPDARRRVVHVLEVPESLPWDGGPTAAREEALGAARAGAARRLEEIESELIGSAAGPAEVSTELIEGDPAARLTEATADGDVDLLVVGGGRADASGRGVLGTTVERVLRGASVPVLVARPGQEGVPSRILAAVDGSDASIRALAWADFLRRHWDASLAAVHVASLFIPGDESLMVPMPPRLGMVTPEPQLGWPSEGEGWLREQLRRAGLDPETVEVRVVIDTPASGIVSEQQRSGADLIVMGTQGRGALGRVFLGTVAGRVLRTAGCAVLVVGAPGRRP